MNNFNGKILGNPLVTPINTYTKKEINNLVVVDNAMSDTSNNAVQNKVIKAFVEEKISEFDEALSKDLVNILTNYITIEQMAEALDTKPSYNDVKIYIDEAILGGAW